MTVDKELRDVKPIDITNYLDGKNIEARPIWKHLRLQPLFEKFNYFPRHYNSSVSDKLFKYGLCLPSGSNMTEVEQKRVIEAIYECLKTHVNNKHFKVGGCHEF